MNQTWKRNKKPNFGPFGPISGPQIFMQGLPLLVIKHCSKLSSYAIYKKTNAPNLRKWQKNFILHPILAYFTQIWTTNFFSSKIWLHQSLDIMVKFHHVQCQKKLMLESWENWVTDRRTNKRMRLIS